MKTIGDAYLAVTGGMASAGGESKAAVLFARDLIAELATMEKESGHNRCRRGSASIPGRRSAA